MDKISAQAVADFLGVSLVGENRYISKITTDSRDVSPDSLFIGIKGERFDGNDFAEGFLNNGGGSVISEKKFDVSSGSAIFVKDTKKAILDVAKYYRNLLKIDVVAVTGSVGKTSTKDMLLSVLKEGFSTSATKGNFNNEIGVPLTVFDLSGEYEKAVIEMGMNNFGEIARLSDVAKPKISVITNIGTAHIGNLGSRENILKAKLEILNGMEKDGICVINADDDLLFSHKDEIFCRTITFGTENKYADYFAYNIKSDEKGSSFCVKIFGNEEKFTLNVPGTHHIKNALSAIACGLCFGMDLCGIKEGVSNFLPTGMRQRQIDAGGVLIIEDCYNASTTSVKSSLETLKKVAKKRSVAVLGDMLEQGDFAEENHRQVGKFVSEFGIDTLVTVGNDARFIADMAKKTGTENVFSFSENSDASKFLEGYLKKTDTVLLKASRGMKFEEISSDLQKKLKGRI